MTWEQLFKVVCVEATKKTNQEMDAEYQGFNILINSAELNNDWLDRFLASKNSIASIRNRPFYNDEIDCLRKQWNGLQEALRELVQTPKPDKTKYAHFKDTVLKFLKLNETNNTPHAAILRLAASILPDYLTSIAAEGNMDELMRHLQNNQLFEDTKIIDWRNKNDFEKSHFLWDTIKAKYQEYLRTLDQQRSDFDRLLYCVPWSILEYFRGEDVREIESLVRDHKNLILTGAPGTGKTYLAKKVASLIIAENSDFENLDKKQQEKFDKQCKFVQFHPSYDYSDFVEGLRPDEKDTQGFVRKNGVFKDFCANACNDITENKYVFIIDEINRGEISKIFGELFFSIDPDYRGEKGRVDTQYQNLIPEGDTFEKGFFVPENVYVIGTMNDIDRSVESMDFAFRRRFAFHEITADSTAKQILRNVKDSDTLLRRMSNLNNAIINPSIGALSKAYQIGASYFKKIESITDNKNKNKSLFDTFIKGVLYEYYRGLPQEDVKKKMTMLEDAFMNTPK